MYSVPLAVVPRMVSTTGSWSGGQPVLFTTAPSSSVWESPNRAAYFPLLVPTTCVVRRLWWVNGSTVSASYNVDVGIYADAGRKPGTRLVSTGSTAQGTATQVQFVDVTDTTLAPGLYWLAIACSSASATFFTSTPYAAGALDALHRFQESSAIPLPSSATPAESSSSSLYVIGFATTASP